MSMEYDIVLNKYNLTHVYILQNTTFMIVSMNFHRET